MSAQKEYITDHRQTYASIASKYGIGKRAVEQFAEANDWVGLRQELVESGLKAYEDKHRQIIAETNDRRPCLPAVLIVRPDIRGWL